MERPDHDRLLTNSRLSALSMAGGAAIVIGSIVFGYLKIQDAEATVTRLESRRDELVRQNTDLAGKRNELQAEIDKALSILGYRNGDNARPRLPASVDALSAATQVMADTGGRQGQGHGHQAGVTLRIYQRNLERDLNAAVVLPKLEALGFAIQRQESMAAMEGVPTNAIWYGRRVELDDVRVVALTLMAAGIQIKAIRPFVDPDAKPGVIEIGGAKGFVRARALTAEYVRTAPDFLRSEAPCASGMAC